MNEDIWVNLITGLGNQSFAIVIASYLLIRFEKKIESLNHSIINLVQVIKDKESGDLKRDV